MDCNHVPPDACIPLVGNPEHSPGEAEHLLTQSRGAQPQPPGHTDNFLVMNSRAVNNSTGQE